MKRRDVEACANVAAHAFLSYKYFTMFFPEEEQRLRYLQKLIASEFKANRKSAHLLVLRDGGKIVSVAQLHAPNYRKPSDFRYLLSGFFSVYRTAPRHTIDDWLKMDTDAAKPCHEIEHEAWYLSSLTVAPQFQGQHYGRRMIEDYLIPYVQQRGGKRLALFTNSEGNCQFYEKLGFLQVHATTITYQDQSMGSWTYAKGV